MDEEAIRQTNKIKVYYGLLKEPEINITIPDDEFAEDAENAESEKPKKKKKRDHILSKKSKGHDPNAPPVTRVPLPELRDSEKLDKVTAIRESAKRLKLGPNSLPSICFYTILNANLQHNKVALCVQISEDSHLLAAGFSDATIKVWALTPLKLKCMKPALDLDGIDREADDVLYRMMDDKHMMDYKFLHGHSGPVYAISFSPDRTQLLSCSEDATIRLWSLQTWSNLCCYKGHLFPVWDVKFSPHGYYFVSCGHDRTAKLWGTDNHQPLRHFIGHLSDVDCVQFHPNSNYVASGSSDFSVKLWDVLNGQCVRHYRGHRNRVHVLAFTNCGRYLASAGEDKRILFWDLAAPGNLVAELNNHHDTIYSLCFCRDGAILASGGNDDCINLWDVSRLLDEAEIEDNIRGDEDKRSSTGGILLGSYRTKATSIRTIFATRRNLFISAGVLH